MPLSMKDVINGTITNAQNATTADTATKLGTSAGSATQPVYFKDGKPVAGTALGTAAYKAVGDFATAGHSHTQYYDSTVSRTANTVLAAPNGSNGGATFRKLTTADVPDANALINNLDTGTAAPVDGDYIITQWANHTNADAASQNKYVRRPMSAIWTYIKSKADSVFSAVGHTHAFITTNGDTRDVATVPNDYSDKLIFKGLKYNSKIGNPSSDTYSYVFGLRGWAESSGGNSYEIAFNNTGIYVRTGATDTWGAWQRVYTTGYKPTKADVGLGNVDNTADSAKSVNYATGAGSATKATNDSKDQAITTYIRGLSASGKTVTYTKGDGTTGTITTQDTTYADATTSAHGLMTAAMVTKLNGIAEKANNYSHPTTSGNKHIPAGGSAGQVLGWASDGTAQWVADKDTTYSNATTSAAGLMSAADKVKLDGVAQNANNYTHPTTAGNKHIPAGGASGNVLGWASDGTAKWDTPTTVSIVRW